jgi:hypothetical protein
LVKIEFEVEGESLVRRSIAHLVGSGSNVHGTEQDILNYISELRADR